MDPPGAGAVTMRGPDELAQSTPNKRNNGA
jgi:hypothetical protein